MASVATMLAEKNDRLRSQKRGARQRLSNLARRTQWLLDYLDDNVVPTLDGAVQAQCENRMNEVRHLLRRRRS